MIENTQHYCSLDCVVRRCLTYYYAVQVTITYIFMEGVEFCRRPKFRPAYPPPLFFHPIFSLALDAVDGFEEM